MTTVGGAAGGFPCDGNRAGASLAGDGQRAPEMSHITPTVPDMDNPSGRYDVTVRVDRDDGHLEPGCGLIQVAAASSPNPCQASVRRTRMRRQP